MRASWPAAVSLLVLGLGGAVPAAGGVFELTDADGVTYFTNAPTDPRYRRMPGMMTGTAVGWLRLPEGSWGRYATEIDEIATRHGVSASLVRSVIRVESAFNPWAVSRKGAQGLMQLMPQTSASLGVRDAFNPRQNIEGGVRHLRYLLDRYPGNATLALAAYNAGEHAVERYGGIPPYQETQQYVRKVLDLHGDAPGGRDTVYRHQASDGTITYTNLPPSQRLRLR
jgi:hypothetical protein